MYQTISEKIAVVGVYHQAKFSPKKFLWRQREYHVKEVTMVTDFKDGGVLKRRYSLVAGVNVYRVLFDRSMETWMLEEVWCD